MSVLAALFSKPFQQITKAEQEMADAI